MYTYGKGETRMKKYTHFQKYLLEQVKSNRGKPMMQLVGPSVENDSTEIDSGDWHPPLLPTNISDAAGLNPLVMDAIIYELVQWIIANFQDPIVQILMNVLGITRHELLDRMETEKGSVRLAYELETTLGWILANWGDPDIGDMIPDFPLRGQLISGNSVFDSHAIGYGGLYDTLQQLLVSFHQQLENGTVYGDNSVMSGWLMQYIQQILAMIEAIEGTGSNPASG